MEPAAGTVAGGLDVQGPGQGVHLDAGSALPPPAGRLGGEPSGVREQLGDGDVADRGRGDVLGQRIVEVEQALVAQPHHQHGDHGLGDRADAVLGGGGGGGALGFAPGAEPDRLAVAQHHGGQRGHPRLGLLDGHATQQRASRTLQNRRHPAALPESVSRLETADTLPGIVQGLPSPGYARAAGEYRP